MKQKIKECLTTAKILRTKLARLRDKSDSRSHLYYNLEYARYKMEDIIERIEMAVKDSE